MKLVLQPEESKICGQCVVAMLLDIPIEDSIAMFGHQRGTRTKDLVKFLKDDFNIETARLTRINKKTVLPSLCIVKVRWIGLKSSHWIIYKVGDVYDSYFGEYEYCEENFKELTGKPTSYLELRA